MLMPGMRQLLSFAARSWLFCFKKAVWVALLSGIMSCLRLALSDSGSGMEGGGSVNVTCPTTGRCEKLPPHCLDCDFDYNCTYGDLTEASCAPLESVECKGAMTMNITFTCQYCYQLPEEETTCTTNTSCNVRGTPSSLYIANCTACDRVFCLPPRNFTKQRVCDYSSGLRWSTAFLLSFTLGGFGVDRFYLNHWGAACGKLITFGGLGVWSILDVILIGTGFLGPADGSAYVF